MNQYLNRAKMVTFIHLCAAHVDLEHTVDEATKRPPKDQKDKDYRRYLKTAMTWLHKAVTLRNDALDQSARENIVSRLKHYDIRLLPTDKMQMELKKIQSDPCICHMETEDLFDLLENTIPQTCGICRKTGDSFRKCPLKRVLDKYGVSVFDASATIYCPYSMQEPGKTEREKQAAYASAIFTESELERLK